MNQVLEVEGLEVTYHTDRGALKAVRDVSFDLRSGEVLGLVGESGCGKSTLAWSLLHLLPPNGSMEAKRLLFKGRDLLQLRSEKLRGLRGREMTMIFQDPVTSLNPVFTIGTQMCDVQRAHVKGVGRGELHQRALEMLSQVGIPDAADRITDFPHQFSGGMCQRIMIAMALMSKPALLIADEPTSSLDVTLEAQILELIRQLRESYETSILYITHDLGLIAQICDRVIVMYAGDMVEDADVVSLFEEPLHPYTRALLCSVPSRERHGERLSTIPGRVPSLAALPPGCKFSDRCENAQPVCSEREPRRVEVNGRQVRCLAYDPESGYVGPSVFVLEGEPESAAICEVIPSQQTSGDSYDDVIVKVEELCTHFDIREGSLQGLFGRGKAVVRAVDGVDLEIQRGEILALVGESGCGKTTLGRTILRLLKPTGGRIIFDGQDITQLKASRLQTLRERMGMIFQDPCSSLSPRLRVSYLLTEPYKIHGTSASERSTVSELLELVGLPSEQAGKYPHELSGGQARRVGIARALALHPELLVADEPTSGLDVSVAASILNLMKDLGSQLGLTYLIITHNLNVVGYAADRVAVMYLGKLVEIGSTGQIFERSVHPYSLALLSSISEPDPRQRRARRRLLVAGEIPSPRNVPPGCRFHTRCLFAEEVCKVEAPALEEIEPDHVVACHFWESVRECASDGEG
jgi:oligopeptide/dipeptide ABC transporter ATP-binding protein